MDNKHLTEQEVATYAELMVDGKLSSIESVKKEYIKNCDTCNEEIIALAEIIEMEASGKVNSNNIVDEKVISLASKSSLNYAWIGIAASIILAAIIIMLLSEKSSSTSPRVADEDVQNHEISIPLNEKVPEPEEVIVEVPKKESIKITIPELKQEEILMAFVTNQELEALSERYNTALRGDDIEVISPNSIVANIDSVIVLQWQNAEAQDLIVEVYNNEAHLIIEQATSANSYQITPTLPEGVYYWKLINSEFDLIYCGKIMVK